MNRPNEAVATIRYWVRGNEYDLMVYSINGDYDPSKIAEDLVPMRGAVGEEPQWVRTIIELGKVGGYMITPTQPPPNQILWFDIDADRNLVQFIDFKL